jgi:hypothetical protein
MVCVIVSLIMATSIANVSAEENEKKEICNVYW